MKSRLAVLAVMLTAGAFGEVTRPPRIVAFGDSITESVIGIRPEENWLRLLQAKLGDRAVTFNAGVGGNSAREAMARFDKDVLARDPDVVLIEFGGNNHDPNRPERHVKDDEFRAHLETFRARLPIGCRVVAVTFPPIKDDWHAYGHHANFPRGLDAAMDAQRDILRDFARENGWAILDLYEILKPKADDVLLKDGVHLNPKGQRAFAKAAEKVLEENGLLKPVAVLTGPEAWGGRPAHPAVVNPVVGQDPASVLSLRGEWEFQTRKGFGRNQPWTRYQWMSDLAPWPFRIQVPGCWEAQGVGDPGEGKCWNVLADNNQKPIRHQYMGVGCYRKRVTIPETWRGKRIWLKVGGAKSVGWFYVNTRAVACVDNFCGTYKYDITDLVTPGQEALVVAQVRNDVPSRKGLFSAMHRWGGLYRDVELEATPSFYIDDAWVRGDFNGRAAEVKVEVGGLNEVKVRGEGERRKVSLCLRATVEGETSEVDVLSSPSPSDFTLKIPLRNFRPWSPEHPNLYTGVVELVANGKVIQTRRERFGIRKLEVRGKEFYLNDKPFFFRAYGDDHVYPITGLTPADVTVHRRHLAVARAAGFNALRFHTHIEVPEYLEAADELGILIEAEMPYYNDEPTEGQVFDPIRDVTELWRHFRRHPSFAVYSMGNEGSFGDRMDREMHRYVKAMDPDRLKINQDCQIDWVNAADRSDYAGGPITIWKRGSCDPDRPFVTHEYMNLGAKLDSRLEQRFTGVWQPPVTRPARERWLAKFGLDLAWGDRLQDASHRLQRVYQKRGVECARTDPYCDGFCFWTIVDVVVANLGTYSAQGLFNPFWEPKAGGFTPADFAVFNSPVGVFLDTDPGARIYTSGQRFRGDVRFANYGDGPLKAARLRWSIDAEGQTLASGSQDVGDLALGGVRQIASLALAAPEVSKPLKATLTLTITSQTFQTSQTSNTYDLWLFPKRTVADGSRIAVAEEYRARLAGRYADLLPEARAAEAEVVLAPWGSQLAADALNRGQRVITLRGMYGKSNVSLGWWWFGAQVGTAFLKHPALGTLPHEGYLSPLLFRVLKSGLPLPFKGLDRRDLIAVGEGGEACYVYLAQANCGKGRLLMDFGLDVLSDTPEGTSILDGLVAYARSSAFAPVGEVEMPVHDFGNGWSKTVKAGESVEETLPFGRVKMDVVRGMAGKNELEWETRAVPANVREKSTFDFRFYGGQGYLAEPPTSFELFVNCEKAIDIPEVTLKDHGWKGKGFALKYVRDPETMENGWYTLTVPSDRLTPGRPATLRIVAKANATRRWFAVVGE